LVGLLNVYVSVGSPAVVLTTGLSPANKFVLNAFSRSAAGGTVNIYIDGILNLHRRNRMKQNHPYKTKNLNRRLKWLIFFFSNNIVISLILPLQSNIILSFSLTVLFKSSIFYS
jgi:hypothetical protein